MPMDADIQLPEGLALSANLIWFDSLIRHQVFSARFSGALRDEAIKILNETEAEIATLVRDKLRSNRDDVPRRLKQSSAVIAQIRRIRIEAWEKIERLMFRTYRDFNKSEINFLQGAFEASVPVIIATAGVSVAKLNSILDDLVFEGRTLHQWMLRTRNADVRRIDAQIKIGIVQGEASGNIARRIVGAARLRGRNGVTQVARKNIESLINTATTAFGNADKQAFINENKEFFDLEVFTAVLDAGTTPICRSLDGNIYKRGDGPIPPLHFGCRSIRIPVISEDAIGSRPFKATSEKILLSRYAQENNLGSIRFRKDLPRGHKGRFDKWARVEARKFIGTVPGKVNYQQWLTRQSKMFQDDVLGKTRGKLFRSGGLTLDRFVDRRGQNIPLWQLAQRDGDAFRAAGLNPGDYLPPAG